MPCLFSYNGITKQAGRTATLSLFSVSPTFRSHSLPIFFLICFRRTAYRQDAPFFFFLSFGFLPKGNTVPKSDRYPKKDAVSCLHKRARAEYLLYKTEKARRFSFGYSLFSPLRKGEVGALFAATRRSCAVFCQSRQSGLKKLSFVYRRGANGPQLARKQPL